MTDGVESRRLRAAMSRAMARTDREMLELAAKAAGIECGADRLDCGVSITLPDGRHDSLPQWNPLTSDGDALRLAVRLKIDFKSYEKTVRAWAGDPVAQRVIASIEMLTGDDPYSATRRAIVRAAAEIGRTMP